MFLDFLSYSYLLSRSAERQVQVCHKKNIIIVKCGMMILYGRVELSTATFTLRFHNMLIITINTTHILLLISIVYIQTIAFSELFKNEH